MPARRAANLARLLAHLVLHKHLSIGVVKTIQVEALPASGGLLLRVLFVTVFSEPNDSTFLGVFQRLAGTKGASTDQGMARETVLVLLQRYMGAAPEEWPKPRRKAHKKRLKTVTQLLDALAVPTFDEW
eukprot:TRINITY_DN27539_c0_g1_i1.p2 TRINITY_DN27539_c0_g1~~TRINITY_DN27539_c0_g1_i1.p2  ORF type:complete len:129 (-),score=33.95 TRINITY_DN27539_c0_g1_i1:70-456(-)